MPPKGRGGAAKPAELIPGRVSTRAKNRGTHPAVNAGLVPAKRRSTTEVQADREHQAQLEAEAESEEQEALENVAELEARQKEQDRQQAGETDPAPKTMTRRVEDSSGPEGMAARTKRQVDDDESPNESPYEEDDNDYERSSGEDESDQDEGDGMLSEDLEVVGSRRRQRKHRKGRADIDAIKASLGKKSLGASSQPSAGERRKNGAEEEAPRPLKRPKHAQRLGGLSAAWRASQNSTIAASNRPSTVPREHVPEPVNITANDFGGFDEEGREDVARERAVQASLGSRQGNETQSLVKIKTTVLYEERAARGRAKNGQRVKPKVVELAPELSQTFTERIAPVIKEYAGAQHAWFKIPVDNLETIISKSLGAQVVAKFDLSDPSDPLMKLCNEALNSWRNRLAQKAEDTVNTLIQDDELLTTVDEIKDFVQYLLGDEGAKAPFVYEHWGGGTERSGRFLHPLILATFSHHVEKVLLPVEGLGLSSSGFPHGALIHSILAVNWALRFWITGEYVKPKKDRKTFYSKDNWGDMKMWTMDPETQEKKLVSILRTSRWNKSVYKLSAEDWRP